MRIEINCSDIDDAMNKLTDLKRDFEEAEEYLEGESGDIIYTDFGLVELD